MNGMDSISGESMAEVGPIELVGGRDPWSIWPMVYEGDSVCVKERVSLKSITRSKNRIGESSTCL